MKNFELVQHVYGLLKQLDVEDVIVCAGARNAPLVYSINEQPFTVTSYFEERSAAFYALGCARRSKKPVAIITTSGTAAAELLPAVIESYYQGQKLILITADRPKSYRGSGAPQSIEQVNLFGPYTQQCLDIDVQSSRVAIQTVIGNLHLNVCFDEPLLDKPDGSNQIQKSIFNFIDVPTKPLPAQKIPQFQKPLFIVSDTSIDKNKIIKLIKDKKCYVYAEFLSSLLNHADLKDLQINHLESELKHLFLKNQFDAIIRIGSVPTLRLWRDMEKELNHIPVINIDNRQFSGLARTENVFNLDFNSFTEYFESLEIDTQFPVIQKFEHLLEMKSELFKKFPSSEPALLHELTKVIESSDPVYVGNSLPIREIDFVCDKPLTNTYANRGANGIDGQLSTYLGWTKKSKNSWAIIGDLTLLYDLAAFGLAADQPESMKNIVVINNNGGQIFNKIFKNEVLLNSQNIKIKHLAEFWNWDYKLIQQKSDFAELKSKPSKNRIIEILVDNVQTEIFWQDWDSECKKNN